MACGMWSTTFLVTCCVLSVHSLVFFNRLRWTEHGHRISKRNIQDIDAFATHLFYKEADLVVIMDRSTGIGPQRYYLREKKMAKALIKQYVTVHPDFARIAVVSFAKDAKVNYDHISSNPIKKCELFEGKNLLDSIPFIAAEETASGTNIIGALQLARNIFKKGRQLRPKAKQYALLFTDGDYDLHIDPYPQAKALMGDKVVIFGVGFGNWLKPGNVRTLSSHYGSYNEWRTLLSTVKPPKNQDMSRQLVRYGSAPSGNSSLACAPHSARFCDVGSGMSKCLAEPGYYWDTANTCAACKNGTFKVAYSNEACLQCPYKGITLNDGAKDKVECICNNATSGGSTCPDPCSPNPCTGDNTRCLYKEKTSACECKPGFTGPNCTVNIDDCANHKCQNGATCVDSVNGYTCLCTWDYKGRYCGEEVNECEKDLCVNNATCTDLLGRYQCNCHKGYFGEFCQDSIPASKPAPAPGTRPPPIFITIPGREVIVQKTVLIPVKPVTVIQEKKVTVIRYVTEKPKNDSETPKKLVERQGINLLAIVMPTVLVGVAAIVVIIVAGVLIVRRQRAEANRKEVAAKAAFFPDFNEFEKKKRGSPTAPPKRRPDLLEGPLSGSMEAVNIVDEVAYSNTEIHLGMDGWHGYIQDLMKNKTVKKIALIRMDGEKQATSPNYELDMDEAKQLRDILEEREDSIPIRVQDAEYVILENDGRMAKGRTIGDTQDPEIIWFGKTKEYVVVAMADSVMDTGMCAKEVDWIMEHIESEGY